MSGASSRNIGGRIFGLCVALALAGSASAADRVSPADYRQFWIWAGTGTAAPALDRAETLYILQGYVGGRGTPDFTRQGIMPSALPGRDVYLVYRLQSLDWDSRPLAGILNQIHAWEHLGTRVAGIQLDFDARTPKLAGYGAFLAKIRTDLPRPYRLSITGLMDWSTGGAPEALDSLAGSVDEIVFQTYRAQRTIANYRDYLGAVARLRLPFKIGLVEGGAWDRGEESRLAASPFYRGAVIFLTGRRKASGMATGQP